MISSRWKVSVTLQLCPACPASSPESVIRTSEKTAPPAAASTVKVCPGSNITGSPACAAVSVIVIEPSKTGISPEPPNTASPVFKSSTAVVLAPVIFSEVSASPAGKSRSLFTKNRTCLHLWVKVKAGCGWAPEEALPKPVTSLAHMMSCCPSMVHVTVGAALAVPAA